MAEMIVSVVLDQLGTLLVKEVGEKVKMAVHVEEDIKKLETTLKTIQAVLRDAEKKQVQNEGVKLWLERLKEVVYEIEDVVDKWNTKLLKSQIRTQSKDKKVLLNPFFSFRNSVLLRNNLGRKIIRLREKLDSIASDKDNYGLTYGMASEVPPLPPREKTSSFVDVSKVYGRDVDRNIIVSKMLSESSQNEIDVPIISIVGMGGLGKTTLAQMILHDKNVENYFGKTMWVCVSEPFDRITLAKAIIEATGAKVPEVTEWNALHSLLIDAVKDKLFILVLDDVWTEDSNQWGPFKLALDGGAPGSRILATTRNERVALMMNSTYIHELVGLTKEDSWSLFRFAASMKMETKDYGIIKEIGEAITKKCKGVPLSIKTVGSLLRFKKNIQDWQEVLESETWNLPEFVKGVLPALLLSYYDLPSSWKPCFTYCAIFPKDCILEKGELIKLWMAQGFLYSTEKRDMEKVGEEYFDGIVSRSLFQDVKTDEDGSIRSCKMHDLVHDFVQFLTKNEILIVERNDITVNSSKLRHLNARNLDDTRATLSSIHKTSLRSLNLKFEGLDGKIFRLWTCLRSLDLSNNYDLCELPNEIGDLIHLRYLDLSMTSVWKLPNSLSNLCNLQTLKLNGCQFICELPASMGNMISLRHLEIYNTERLRFLPEGIERLASLRSLSKFIVSKGRKLGDLKGLNLIQGSIEISGLRRVKSANEAKEVQLASKRGIHALTLDFGLANELENISEVDKERMEGVLEGLQPHPNLEKLKINQYPGSKLPSWMILFSELRVLELKYLTQCTTLLSLGRLPLLEVLRIDGMISVRRLGLDFLGISDIEEENDDATSSINKEKLVVFPNLIKLHIMEMSELEEWVLPFERSDDTLQIMPRLQILDIWSSPKLKALPALGRLESLEELDISGLDSLQRIGPEFFGISEDDVTRCGSSRGGESVPIIVFPKLKTLDFSFISELEEWEMMMPSWREDVSFIMPCLKELRLGFCKKLKVVPHNIFSYQPVKERIEFCSELNKRSRRNQIIIRREVGESLSL